MMGSGRINRAGRIKEKRMKKMHQAVILAAIYALALGARIYWLSQKEGMHVDEGLSTAMACYNEFMVTENYQYGKEYKGKELKEASLVNDPSLKDAVSDIVRLRKDNRDPPHTNLYYSLFRLSLIGLKTGDMGKIIFRGAILNLLFFTASFILFFLLMRLLFPGSELLQYAATLCAFLSTATLSNTLFLRPYQIQETLFILFSYCFVLSLGWKKTILHERKLFVGIKPLVLMSLLTAVTLLSGYYALLFIGLFGLYAVYLLCKDKKYIEIPFYFSVLGLGLLIAWILYPNYFSGFFSYRGTETVRTLSGSALENIGSSLGVAGTLLHKHFFTWPVVAVLVLCLAGIVVLLLRERKQTGLLQILRGKIRAVTFIQKMAWYIFAAAVLYLFAVLILAPYKILRYTMPVFPFLVILPAMLINSMINSMINSPGEKLQKITAAALLVLCGCFAFNALQFYKIENKFHGKPDQYMFTQDQGTPVYVLNAGWSLWKYPNLIPYLHDEQSYYFIDWWDHFEDYMRSGQSTTTIELPDLENYNSIFLLTEYFPDFPEQDALMNLVLKNLQAAYGSIENEWVFDINTGEPESDFPYFKGVKLRSR